MKSRLAFHQSDSSASTSITSFGLGSLFSRRSRILFGRGRSRLIGGGRIFGGVLGLSSVGVAAASVGGGGGGVAAVSFGVDGVWAAGVDGVWAAVSTGGGGVDAAGSGITTNASRGWRRNADPSPSLGSSSGRPSGLGHPSYILQFLIFIVMSISSIIISYNR